LADYFRTPVAVHLFLLRAGEILMLRRQNTGFEDGNYSVVGVHLDGGETIVEAAIREGREEAGVVIAPGNVRVTGVMHRRAPDEERIDFFVTIERWQGEVTNCEPHKCSDLSWFPLDALPSNTIPYVRQAIANVLAGQWFDSWGWE
jgi:ADP-ribose pyrophosphatase YjhB (NUDIX family)